MQWRPASGRPYRGSMNAPRFNYDCKRSATLRRSARKYPKWIRVSQIGGPLLRARGSGRRKIFAIVMPSISVRLGRKPIRRILIFDNHPDSLRLISERRLNVDVDLAMGRGGPSSGLPAPPHTSSWHVFLGLALVLALILGMIWPLIVS